MPPIGSRFVQLVFETLHSPASLTYEKRSGNYQGQNGDTSTNQAGGCPGRRRSS